MNAARKLILLVLVVLLTFQGCASNLRCLVDSGSGSSTYAAASDEGGLQQTRHGEVRALIWAAVGVLIIGAFIADLFILPYSCYHHHHYFPCCSAVISIAH